MTSPRRADLQLEVTTLEPDPGMLERLAFVAGAAAPARPPRRRRTGLRVAVATTAVAGISVGGAWATVGLITPHEPDRAPVEQPTVPAPSRTPQPTGPPERPHATEGSTRPDPRQNGGRDVAPPVDPGAADTENRGAEPDRGQGQGQEQGQGQGEGHEPGRGPSQRPTPGQGTDNSRAPDHAQAPEHAQASEHVPDRDPRPAPGRPDITPRAERPERGEGAGLGSGKP